jgi:hypothetical protein
MTHRLVGILVIAFLLAIPLAALAQDEDIMPSPVSEDELDVQPEPGIEAEPVGKADGGVVTYWGDEPLDEVIKGFYINTRVGTQLYFGGYGDHADPGFMYGFGLGYDIVPWLFSMELGAIYSFHGANIYNDLGMPETGAKVSGDFGALRVPLAFHFRYYTTKRFEATADLTGGIVYNSEAVKGYETTGVSKGSASLDYFAGARLGVEYYTGLRHFSLGFDVEVDYYIASSTIGLALSPMMKYTF